MYADKLIYSNLYW